MDTLMKHYRRDVGIVLIVQVIFLKKKKKEASSNSAQRQLRLNIIKLEKTFLGTKRAIEDLFIYRIYRVYIYIFTLYKYIFLSL